MTKLKTRLLKDLPVKTTPISDSDYVINSNNGTTKLKVKDITKHVENRVDILEDNISEFSEQLDNKPNKSQTVSWVNAKEMFNIAADGVTDESDKINQALTYIHNLGGGTLYFPKGIYIYSKALWFGVNTTIIGDGIGNTIFKMKNNIDLDKASIGNDSNNNPIIVTGFIGMRDVETKFSAFYNLEIDGNCSNNRHWNNGIPPSEWANFGTNINGISYDSVPQHKGKPIPPKNAIIENVYIHDTVRNCVLAKMNGTLNINNCIFENSDVDHTLYIQNLKGTVSNINNITIKGYCRDSYIQANGCNINNIVFTELKNNPTKFTVKYLITSVNKELSNNLENGLNISNVQAFINTDYLNESYLDLFNADGYMNIKNCKIKFLGDVTRFGNNRSVLIAVSKLNNYDFSGVTADTIECINVPKNFKVCRITTKTRNKSIVIKNINVYHYNNEVYGNNGGLLETDSGCDAIGVLFDNVFIDLCSRIFSVNNTTLLDNVIVTNSKIGNSPDFYFLDGNLSGLAPKAFLLQNVEMGSLRANSTRANTRFLEVYLNNNNIRTNIKKIASLPQVAEIGDIWQKNNLPCVYNGEKWIYYDGADVN